MQQPMLFLMVGYPGSGKTTASKMIHRLTGAVHLWADHERKKMFGQPMYDHAENLKLYAELNHVTDQLLAQGKSVVFDTNFNFYKDREHLRALAAKHGAHAVVIWVIAPQELARERATKDAHTQDTRVLGDIPVAAFERIVRNLEPPRDDEHVIRLDGAHITMATVAHALETHSIAHSGINH